MSTARLQGQAELPRIEVHRTLDGRTVIKPSAVPDVVVEQTQALPGLFDWGPAQTTAEGVVNDRAPMQFFRLRLLPAKSIPLTAAHAGVPGFQETPPVIRSGESIQFSVMADAETEVHAEWKVNGKAGGSAENGFITEAGKFTAPAASGARKVTISAEIPARDGARTVAQTVVDITAAPPFIGQAPIAVADGGIVESTTGRASIQIPPNSLDGDRVIQIRDATPDELAALNENPALPFDVIAQVELLPGGTLFSEPAEIRMKLSQHLEPGTRLPVELKQAGEGGSEWVMTDIEGEVESDGVTFVFSTPHFSIFRLTVKRQFLTIGPVIREASPGNIREGELRPILVRGTNFSRSLRATIHLPGNPAPTPNVQVMGTAFDLSARGEFGVLVKSFPDQTLAAGASRIYTLKLTGGLGFNASVNITVDGLNEFNLEAGQVATVSNPLLATQVFSRIGIGFGSELESRLPVLAWQATDRVEILGRVVAKSDPGLDGSFDSGGGSGATRPPPPGAGIGGSVSVGLLSHTVIAATAGVPVLTPDLTQYLPGTLNRLYGQPGRTGHHPGDGHYRDPLPAVSEGMYELFAAELRSELPGRDPFDFDFWREIAEDLTERHPEGRKGHQGVPGGFRSGNTRAGFRPAGRIVESGGGGGGGGGSYRPNREIPLAGTMIGLGGGSGGGGSGAISLAAGGELYLGGAVLINTTGGSGGHGSAPRAEDFSIPAAIGRGGGGGPGGAGTIHLLAGERLSRTNGSHSLPFLHSAGAWGQGGFLMSANTHRQANPRSWLEPAIELPALSEAELAGPDFSSANIGLRTGIQLNRAVEAFALNPYQQPSAVRVISAQGTAIFRLRGLSASTRKIRLLLAAGHNRVSIHGHAGHAVLDRDVLVLNSPDTDGDGLANLEEPGLGYDPARRDTDGDGMDDGDEWLAGGDGVPNDSDGDLFPDPLEEAWDSDPFDPAQTPMTVGIGTGSAEASFVAGPNPLRVTRPAFGAPHGVPPNTIFAAVRDLRVIRPEFGPWQGPASFVSAAPHGLHVVRPAIGAENGVPYSLIMARPRALRVERQ